MAVRTYGPLRRGWRFSPNDEELIKYLREKNADELPEIEEIPDVDICKFEPEDLPGKSLIKTDDLEWFFFSPFKRKYQRGCRKDRMTNTGYWKVTGKDRNIKSRSSKLIGKKRTLVFYEGRAPRCERTNWIAHEYQTIENGVDGKKCEEGAFVVYRVKKKLDGDANSNCNNVGNDFAPTINMPFPDDTRVGNAVERFETPLNQGILESSDMPVERSAADETDGRLYPTVSGEGHCISRISAGVDGYDAEATEVETQVQSSKNSDQPECSSPLGYEFLSPLNQNVYAGMGHNPKSPLSSDNFGTGQQLVFDDCSSNWDFIRASLQGLSSPTRVEDYKLSRNCLYDSTTSIDDTDSEVAASQVTTAEGLGSGSINSLPIDAFHDMLPNHTESSSEEYLTNRNNMIPLKKSRSNMIRLNMINVKDDWQDSSKNAWRVASKPHIRSSRRIQLMEKTHRQCGDAEDQPVTAAIIVGRENGAVGTRVNGGLCSTELEEELEKRLATLQLADKTQAEASHNLEGMHEEEQTLLMVCEVIKSDTNSGWRGSGTSPTKSCI
ncbi:hypothetical protein AAC387_Pa01g3450 [Persea americana]